MIPITHYTDLEKVEALIHLDYGILQNLAREMLNETQEALYSVIWKAHMQNRGGLDVDNIADEIAITVISNGEIQNHTGFVSEFQVSGKHGWQLWLSDGKEWVYHNDWDDTEDDQLLWVEISRQQVEVDTD